MKKLAILSPLVLLATTALAQDSTCILQPSCSQLGYTSAEADCGTAKVLRCPFDVSQVACVGGGSDSGGSGAGGEPSDEFGTVDNSSCQVGYIYYSDDTCSPEYNYFKDPIGIVFDANRRYIVGLNEKRTVYWSTQSSTNAAIPYITEELDLLRDFNGASYTKAIEDLNTPTYYPAAKFCIESTAGDKEWFLPSFGQMYILNQTKTTVNEQIAKITYHTFVKLNNYGSSTVLFYWTSTLYSASEAYYGMGLSPDAESYQSFSSSINYSTGGSTSYRSAVRCIAEY